MPMTFAEVLPTGLFRSGTFKWRLQTRVLSEESWLQIDDRYDADRAEKTVLLESRFDECVVSQQGSEAPSAEVLDLVHAELERRGLPSAADDSRHPLDAAARLVQEDLMVMQREPRGWVLTAASVCFPTRWDLGLKVGRTLDEIHEPVPQYQETVGDVVNRFFDRLQPGRLIWRPNWSLVDDPTLRLDPVHREAPAACPTDPGRLLLRVERQTLRRLTNHPDAICFTVRVHRWPLIDVVDELSVDLLAGQLTSVPADIAEYKNIDGLRDQLSRWIRVHHTS